jgi:DNA-directed RNA polymerase specialized sigma24 family protein
MTEHFKVVKRTRRSLYEISDRGTVRINGTIVPQSELAILGGYRYLSSIGGYIHRVVAKTFLGEPEDKSMIVSFIDGDRENITVDNLEWTTYRRANNRAIRRRKQRGRDALVDPSAYYVPKTPVETAILNLWIKHRMTTAAINELTGMSKDKVQKIVNEHRIQPSSRTAIVRKKHEIKYDINDFHNPRKKLHRDIIRLRVEEEMTYENIAATLNTSLQIVKNVLNRYRIREGETRIDYQQIKEQNALLKAPKPKCQRERTKLLEEKWEYYFPRNEVHQQVINLRKNLGYNYEDIATEFDLSLQTVNGILSKYRVK